MRRRHPITSTLFAAAVLMAGALVCGQVLAQQNGGPAPVKPYKAVSVKPPAPLKEPGLDALRKQLADIAARKDRAALAKLVVNQGFFWLQDQDLADKTKPGIENLAKAMTLDAKDGSGWDGIASFASDPTGKPMRDHAGVICSPADPVFDAKEFDAVVKSSGTEVFDWGYIVQPTDVRGAGQPNAPVIDKLGLILVRVMMEDAPPPAANAAPFIRIATPAGKTGFVPIETVAPLGGDQMCFAKDGSGWKITGYIGGADQ